MEKQIQISTKFGNLRGVLHETNVKPSKGIIVIIHGYFSSQKIGPAKLYVQLGRLFESLGYCVYRFDVIGVGDSDGKYGDFTFDTHKRDIVSIINFIKKTEHIMWAQFWCQHSIIIILIIEKYQ